MLETLRLKFLGFTLGDVQAGALVAVLADTLPEIKTNTLRDKLGDLESKALFDMLAYTLGELMAKTVA